MRTTKLMFIVVCCLVITPIAWGQAATSSSASTQTATTPAKPGILGYLDPHTGAFRPVPQAVESSITEDAAVSPTTGTITLTLTITLKTTGLTTITCSAEVSIFDGTTSPRSFLESESVAATGTVTTRTCKITIPYSWSLATASSDMMSTSYTVTGSTGTMGLPQRTSAVSPFSTIKVPANGTPTSMSANVTL